MTLIDRPIAIRNLMPYRGLEFPENQYARISVDFEIREKDYKTARERRATWKARGGYDIQQEIGRPIDRNDKFIESLENTLHRGDEYFHNANRGKYQNWGYPFSTLFPLGLFSDHVSHKAEMVICLNMVSQNRLYDALRLAEDRLGERSKFTYVSWEDGYVLPFANGNPKQFLRHMSGHFELMGFNTVAELLRSDRYQELKSRMPSLRVRRVFGWVGYFWWEILRFLRTDAVCRICRVCGDMILGGHVDRVKCKRGQNLECDRKYDRELKRARSR
jgi:hypothetical protein